MTVDLRALIAKLDHETRGAIEAAAGLCLSRTHYDVEVEHYLLKLLDVHDADAGSILRHYGVDRSRLAADLTASLDALKSGNARTPSLSPTLVKMLTEAWTLGSVEYGASRIRSAHTILALLANDELNRLVRGVSREFEKIRAEDLRQALGRILTASAEAPADGPPGAAAERGGHTPGGETPNVDRYTIDLTERARRGLLDPVLGRELEVRQVLDILMRRRQNNPILVGEAGVGKTAVVEGFAMRIVQDDVPPVLRKVTLRTLDLALLQAGAGVKGEFENRLRGLIAEVCASPVPIILFIDEAHTMIGAGGQAGQNDAANLLKPALARGELRTIAATTWSEYKRYFEKDPALTRRFQRVQVEEPSEPQCGIMMRGVAPSLERHHGVRILDEAVDAAVRLSKRYLPDRQLPDKAVSVLDTACARLALGQGSTPAVLEDAIRQLEDLDVQARVLERESALGADHAERLSDIAERRAATEASLASLRTRWDRERELVARVRAVRQRIEDSVTSGAPESAGDAGRAAEDTDRSGPGVQGSERRGVEAAGAATALRRHLAALTLELEDLQGESPLVPVCVDAALVGQVISGWTGIPVGKMLRDDVATALSLERHLGGRVIGQLHALEAISHRLRTSRAGIEDPDKPVGVFLLVGPSGVGKTETALALSDLLYGGEHNLITINMSEFQEAHTVSTLKGSPPGYVGYGEGGVLTEAVRRRPYSVVLLDEIEKAHADVLELFYQVFDKGRLEDGEGREIDFKNTVLVLTTNVGAETILSFTADPETVPQPAALAKALKPELDEVFKPAFLGRLVVVPYLPLRDEALERIVALKIGKVRRRLAEVHKVELILDDAVIDAIAQRCVEAESGARNVDNILTNTMLPALSRLLLESLAAGRRLDAVRVGRGEAGDLTYGAQQAAGSDAREDVPVPA